TVPTQTPQPQDAISAEGRLRRAKENYLGQNYLLTTPECQMRQVREYGMEKITAKLPPEMRMEAQAIFYENEVKAAAQAVDLPKAAPALEDAGIDR
ncbi:hypothetical protein, partial [Snodgrassella sp. CFCC 13594]|uniref:hypothetical protein n=1 Tax=Snodgrassella sp. CFCC 13594 TaxID=1775559 RepID=UPI000A893271